MNSQNFQQLGFIFNNDERYPLYGRPKYSGRSDRYEYYIIDETRNRLKIPYKSKNDYGNLPFFSNKNVIENIKKVKKIKSKPHNFVVKKFGKACSYPGTFNGGIHAIITSKSFKTAVIKTIKAGGCNCSRANFVGAYFAAYKGLKGIPQDWIKKTNPAKRNEF